MTDVGTVVSLASAFGVGSIAGAAIGVVLRARHERTERFRERMVLVAEEFLHAVEEAHDAVQRARRAAYDWNAAQRTDQFVAAAEKAREAIESANGAINTADRVVARLAVAFPPTEGTGIHERAHAVTQPLYRATGIVSFGLTSPPINEQALSAALQEQAYAYGRFSGTANRSIWNPRLGRSRWPSRVWRSIIARFRRQRDEAPAQKEEAVTGEPNA